MKIKEKHIFILIIFYFLILTTLNNLLYGEPSPNTLSENIVIKCDITKLPKRLPYIIISDESINKEELLNQWIPEKSVSDYEEIKLMGTTIKRYLSDISNKKISVEFGPYGYVCLNADGFIPNSDFLTLGKSEKIAEEFIEKYFDKVPSDSVKKSISYKSKFGEEGYKITYTRKFNEYEILSTDRYLGDIIEIIVCKNGDFSFERIWHKIKGTTDSFLGNLMDINKMLNEAFKNEIKENKKIYIQNIVLMYYFNPMEILTLNTFKPLYRITGNGKYYYADGIKGYRISPLRETSTSFKYRKRNQLLIPYRRKSNE